MKRPAPGDCSEYFHTYTSKVEDDDVLSALERQVEETASLLSGLDEAKALHRYAPEK